MSNVQLFNFKSNQIRVVEIEGAPWFVGADVVKVLYGTSNGQGHRYDKLDEAEKTLVSRKHLGMTPGKPVTLISESGLYKLVMRSDKPEARRFQQRNP